MPLKIISYEISLCRFSPKFSSFKQLLWLWCFSDYMIYLGYSYILHILLRLGILQQVFFVANLLPHSIPKTIYSFSFGKQLENIKQWTKIAKLSSPPNCKTKTLVGSGEQENWLPNNQNIKERFIFQLKHCPFKGIILRHSQYKTLILSGLGMDLCLFLMP